MLLGLALLIVLAPTPLPGALAERMARGAIALAGSRGAAALPELEAALELSPGSHELRWAAAQAAWLAGQPQHALELLAKAGGGPTAAACLEAEIQLIAGEQAAGLELLSGASPACEAGSTLLTRLAGQLLAQGAWESAEILLKRLIELEPGSAWAQAQYGALLATRDPMQALGHLRLAEQLAPGDGGSTHALIRSIEDGSALGGRALALAQAGQALAAGGRWELARRALEGAIALDPQAAGAWALLGVAIDQLGGDGGDQLQTAVELAPESSQVQLLAARHWRGRGRLDLALTALEAAARIAPADPVVASDLASLYLAQGDLPSAEAAYTHAVTVAPDDPLFWGLLARFSLEHELDVQSLGLPAARRALQLAPEDAQAVDLLAAGHYLLGDFRLADRLTWQALQLDPRLASAHYHRGLAMLALGDLTGAVRSLGQAQSLDPQGRVGELAGRSLANLPR